MRQRGITLVEVLIAMTILAVITALSAQSLRQGFTTREKIQKNLDHTSQLRDAFNLIQQDIRMMVNYDDLELRFYEAVKKHARNQIQKQAGVSGQQPGAPGQPPGGFGGAPGGMGGLPGGPSSGEFGGNPGQPGGGGTPPINPALIQQQLQNLEARFPKQTSNRKLFQTFFKGNNDKIFFFSGNSLLPPSTDHPFAPSLVKISYQVRSCPQNSQMNCLIRFAQPTGFLLNPMELERVSGGVPIIKDVRSFEIRYRGRLQQDWVSAWNSEANVTSQKSKVPEAIEMNLEIGKEKHQLITYVHFPNNKYENQQSARR